jgi:DNA-binding FrmR family transcriptional regulator
MELAEQGRRLQGRVNSINQMINQAEDGPVPNVIRQTIERLKEESSR